MKPPFKIAPEELEAFAMAIKGIYDVLVGVGFAPEQALSLMGQTFGIALGTALAEDIK